MALLSIVSTPSPVHRHNAKSLAGALALRLCLQLLDLLLQLMDHLLDVRQIGVVPLDVSGAGTGPDAVALHPVGGEHIFFAVEVHLQTLPFLRQLYRDLFPGHARPPPHHSSKYRSTPPCLRCGASFALLGVWGLPLLARAFSRSAIASRSAPVALNAALA